MGSRAVNDDTGKQFEIDNYCLCDTMDTYFVFLRTRVMVGELKLDQEQALIEQARQQLLAKAEQDGYFREYLEHFGEWTPAD